MRNTKNITASYSGSYKYENNSSDVAQAQIQKRYANINVTTNINPVKQNQDIIYQATVTDVTKNHKNTTIINQDGFVFFKLNGKTIRDSTNNTLLVKVVNGKANYTYHVPGGTGGVKNNAQTNYTVIAVYTNDNYYPDNSRNTTVYNVERSPITIDFTTSVNNGKNINHRNN